MNNIKIVLIGGPCGGKTTSVCEYKERLSKKYNVQFIEETASSLLNLGYLDELPISSFDFQNLLFKIQFINEYIAEQNSEILLCDRGLFDAKAYLSEEDFNRLLKANKMLKENIMSTYDGALYFSSIAYNYPEMFSRKRKYETPEKAIERDALSLKIWHDKLISSIYSDEQGFEIKKEIIYNSLVYFLKNNSNNDLKSLVDFYDETILKIMVEEIEEILFNNNIPKKVKSKTMELIR